MKSSIDRDQGQYTWLNGLHQERAPTAVGLEGNPVSTLSGWGKRGEQFFPVSTIADGLLYNTLIMSIKRAPKPIAPNIDRKKGRSKRSNAFIALLFIHIMWGALEFQLNYSRVHLNIIQKCVYMQNCKSWSKSCTRFHKWGKGCSHTLGFG